MNEQYIWDYLMSRIGNPYGVAALMGNLYVESRLNPMALQTSWSRHNKMTADEYVSKVDSNEIGDYTFAKDGAGFGLVQWTFWSRKMGLYHYAKENNASIGDLNTQLGYLWKELNGYESVVNTLRNTLSINEASDVVCEKYERPADQSDAGKANRAKYAQQIFDRCADRDPVSDDPYVGVTASSVNIRTGNGLNYTKVGRLERGQQVPWIATAINGWYAIKYNKDVRWVSDEFTKLVIPETSKYKK